MKKVKGLTNRIVAMLMSGMLVVGSVSGTVFASENQADIGQTSEIATEDLGEISLEEATTENVSDEGMSSEEVSNDEYNEAAAQEEEAVTSYTVTLDANGGYFANEWDDSIGEIVATTEILTKVVPVGGVISTFPMREQENASVTFLGWNLERDGELVSQGYEEYAPVENCVLYAVWQVEEATDTIDTEDSSWGESVIAENQGMEPVSEVTDQTDSVQEFDGTEPVAETDASQEFENNEIAEELDDAQEFYNTEPGEETDASQESNTEIAEELDDAQEFDSTDPVDESDTDAGYVFEETETAEELDAVQEYDKNDLEEESEIDISQESVITETEESGNIDFEEDNSSAEAYAAPVKVGNGTADLQDMISDQEEAYADENIEKTSEESSDDTVAEEETQPELIESSGEEETVREDASMGVAMSGICGDNLTWILDDEGTLTISGTGEMFRNLGWESTHWWPRVSYAGNVLGSKVKAVMIEEGVTSIGDHAFYSFYNLTSVTIPRSVLYISYGAFENCSNLPSVTIPDGVSGISMTSFMGCTKLSNISFPSSVTRIDSGAFFGCNSLTVVNIPDTIEYIGPKAFDHTPWQKAKGEFAIWNNTLLRYQGTDTDVIIPDGIEKIGAGAFAVLSDDWSTYSIAEQAVLESVIIPEGVRIIDAMAFDSCRNLTNVIITKGTTEIRSCAFRDCSSLTYISLPSSVTSMGVDVFSGCKSLKSITLPAGMTTIEYGLCSMCSSLETIDIPFGIKKIDDAAFHDCTALTDIYYAGSKQQWEAIDIGGNNAPLLNAAIHYNCGLSISLNDDDLSQPYTGSEIKPVPVVKGMRGTVLTEGKDYTLTYENNIEPGTALIKVTGRGDYEGQSVEVMFEIVSDVKIWLDEQYEIVSREFDRISFNIISKNVEPDSKNVTCMLTPLEGQDSTVDLGAVNIISEEGKYIFYQEINVNSDGKYRLTVSFQGVSASATVVSKSWKLENGTLTILNDSTMEKIFKASDAPWYEKRSLVKHIVVDDKVEYVSDYAFSECNNVITIRIGKMLKRIGKDAFQDKHVHDHLKEVIVDSENKNFITDDGVLYDKEFKTLILYPAGNSREEFTLHNGVEIIKEHSFVNCSHLKRIVIPNSLKEIEDKAVVIYEHGDSLFPFVEILFLGDVPVFGTNCFLGNVVDVYYLLGNDTWTDDVKKDYGGTVNWNDDIDGDAIPDVWEFLGADTNEDGLIDLDFPRMGAVVGIPDIFVEIDWMNGYRPKRNSLKMVYESFRDHGIQLHIDAGSDSVDFVTGNQWADMSGGQVIAYSNPFIVGQNADEWQNHVRNHLATNRLTTFHYACFVNRFLHPSNGRTSYTGVTSHADWGYASIIADLDGKISKKDIAQAGTFMHELGHALGLQHSNTTEDDTSGLDPDDLNFLPNHLTVMNY